MPAIATVNRWKNGTALAGGAAPPELTALSQALMLLIGGIAVIAMLWMASEGVGGNNQPGR